LKGPKEYTKYSKGKESSRSAWKGEGKKSYSLFIGGGKLSKQGKKGKRSTKEEKT